MNQFDKNLASGVQFEDEVTYELLAALYPEFGLEDCHNHQMTNQNGSGPRIRYKNKYFILPDYRLTNLETKEIILVDAKRKSTPMELVVFGKKGNYHSLDRKKFLDYQKTARFVGAELFLIVGDEKLGGIYRYHENDFVQWRKLFMGKRKELCPLFPAIDKYRVADLIINGDGSLNFRLL